MTPEVRAALLSKVPFSSSATIEYTPKSYFTKNDAGEYLIPEDFRPVFTVRPFLKAEIETVKKSCSKGEENSVREWARKAVVGWVKLFDAGSMEEIDYVPDAIGGCDKTLWSMIPDHICGDILMYASSISGILDREKVGL
ncbi:MAG: hypothetical protein EHM87_16125 [Burkholderiales bacterium]|nr:MAG: hypothetical protein EHM87_16125 [Burkholderiales bacterium]